MEQTPRVLSMTVQDIKRIRLGRVEFDADDRVIVVSGRNGAGKSSLLDAFVYALIGPNRKDVPHPVREGAEEGKVTLDLGTMTVTRRIAPDGKTLALEVRDTATGAQLRSPQRRLNELLGEFNAFDPIEFMALSAKDQVTALLSIVRLPFDPVELDQQRQLFYDRRREVGRDVERLSHQVAGFDAPRPDLPAVEVSTTAIVAEVRAAEQELAAHRSLRSMLERADTRAEHLRERHAQLLAEAGKIAEELAEVDVERAELRGEVEGLVDPDIGALQAKMGNAEEINREVRAASQRRELADELAEVEAQVKDFTDKITEIDRTKAEALARADMPVPGLSFDDDGLTLTVDGVVVPLVQCSSAEQLRVSMAMAMRANPAIRVVRIADGSLLDGESMRLVRELAEANDFYVLVERVDDNVEAGVVEITAGGEVTT